MRTLPILVLALLAAGPARTDEQPSGASVLQRKCVQCHNPDTRMGELDLTSRDGALAGGTRGPALDPSSQSPSLLLLRVEGNEMPPGNPLSLRDKESLRAWISSGAPWPHSLEQRRAGLDWWAFQPLRDPVPPGTDSLGEVLPARQLDTWVLARLQSAGLRPSPEARKADLVRRVTFGLTGLPPEPSEVRAFVEDPSPDAYERLVDRLLASPHHGERWARHWLDVVRYAESEGFERDLPRDHAWPYRDYVIRSFNSDKPYLQFALEQMAGDVLEQATADSITATTMLTLGPVDAVGLTSAIPSERASIREDMLEDILGTVTQTFLGLTVNCARCHDHKFDPIAQEEYYGMKAAFQAIWPPTRPVPEKGLDVFFPFGTPLLAPAEQRDREQRIAGLRREMEAAGAELGSLYRSARTAEAFGKAPRPYARWTFDTDTRADFAPLHLQLFGDTVVTEGRLDRNPAASDRKAGAVDEDPNAQPSLGVSGMIGREIRAKTLEAWIDVETAPESAVTVMEIRGLSGYRGASVDGIRLETGDRPHWENSSVGQFRSRDTGGPTESLEPGTRVQVAITYADDGTITLFRNGSVYGEPYLPDSSLEAGRLQVYRADDAVVRFAPGQGLGIAEARLYGTALPAEAVRASYAAGIRDLTRQGQLAQLGSEQRRRVKALDRRITALSRELEEIPEPVLSHAATVRDPGPTRLLVRGSVDQPGKLVDPAGLSCIAGWPGELHPEDRTSEGSRRLAVARWIAHAGNPLFARVIANRVWQHHFGRGLVDNPSDLGYNGGLPSHPGLLDHLASRLVRSGWSLKALHRSILLSRTYRQASAFDRQAADLDADNRLLWRFPHRRLSGEAVRDSMLAVAGELNRSVHGPSFRPFEYGEPRGSLRRYLLAERDTPATRRRTLYRMNVITAGDPMLEALDCPLPSVRSPRRRSTSTPLQALSLMNNTFVQQRARGFAARVRTSVGTPAERVRQAYRLALGRQPDAPEMAESLDLLQQHGLETLCWGLLNTSEFLYVR